MTGPKKSLFRVVVDAERLHPDFDRLCNSPGSEPARNMLDDIFQDFEDPDGNFIEQFQTTGFNSRYFELYLFAYFSRSDFLVKRPKPAPDFLVSRNGMTVAVEATTVNPSQSGVLAAHGRKMSDLRTEEIPDYVRNELAIRFGSPLFSKLKKCDWKLDHCRDIPFVLAIQDFHDREALLFSDSAIFQFLYGLRQSGSWTHNGELDLELSEVKEHRLAHKSIPSNFFSQPECENISAVLFTNSGTYGKFSRMGYQAGYGCNVIDISRTGFCFNSDPQAMDATLFSYNLDEPPWVETWGQGLVVFHNPRCRKPIPVDFFPDAVQGRAESGAFVTRQPGWHPFASITSIVYLGDRKTDLQKLRPRTVRSEVVAIARADFQAACGFAVPDTNPFGEEDGWFSDDTSSFLGVVIKDKTDGDWGYIILARDEHFRFRPIRMTFDFITRDKARAALQFEVVKLVGRPRRVFSSGSDTP